MAEHSPAPWGWQGYEPGGSNPICGDYDPEPMAIFDGNDDIIAYVDHYEHSMEVAIANANILHASLDLLEACQAALANLDYLQSLWSKEAITDRVADGLRKAVLKALGEA